MPVHVTVDRAKGDDVNTSEYACGAYESADQAAKTRMPIFENCQCRMLVHRKLPCTQVWSFTNIIISRKHADTHRPEYHVWGCFDARVFNNLNGDLRIKPMSVFATHEAAGHVDLDE